MNQSIDAPTFSTIMPLYNHSAFVAEAVRSVIAQTWQDWELIIVDDGSTDGCEKIVEEFAAADKRIRVIHQANAGCSAARAAGIRLARGTWMTYLDSDDVWRPTALADFHEYIQSHSDVQFIYGYRHRLNADGTITELPGQFQDRPTGPTELFQRIYISHLCVCYRREFLLKVGGYDPALRHADDYDLYLRMCLLTPLCPLGKPTGLRRRHPGCISIASGFSRMLEAEVLRRFVEHRGGKDVLDPVIVRKRLGHLYYSASKLYLRERRYRQAHQAAIMGRRYRRTIKGELIAAAAAILKPLPGRDNQAVPQL